MEIYVEYVIIDNMIINTLMLSTTNQILVLKTRRWRLVLSAFVGTAFALVSPLLNSLISILIKPLIAYIMVVVAFKTTTAKKFFITILTFLLTTFLFGGACFGIMEVFDINYIIINDTNCQYNFPVGIILLIVFLTYYAFKNLTTYIFKKNKNKEFVFNIKIYCNNVSLTESAFLDSGNCLSYNNEPICVINFSIFNKLFPLIKLEELLLKKLEKFSTTNFEYVTIDSLSNTSTKMLVFKPDKIVVNNDIIKNCYLGLSYKNFGEKLECNCILNKEILN